MKTACCCSWNCCCGGGAGAGAGGGLVRLMLSHFNQRKSQIINTIIQILDYRKHRTINSSPESIFPHVVIRLMSFITVHLHQHHHDPHHPNYLHHDHHRHHHHHHHHCVGVGGKIREGNFMVAWNNRYWHSHRGKSGTGGYDIMYVVCTMKFNIFELRLTVRKQAYTECNPMPLHIAAVQVAKVMYNTKKIT